MKGPRRLSSPGKEFDPQYHQASLLVEHNEAPENTIIEEFQRGFPSCMITLSAPV